MISQLLNTANTAKYLTVSKAFLERDVGQEPESRL